MKTLEAEQQPIKGKLASVGALPAVLDEPLAEASQDKPKEEVAEPKQPAQATRVTTLQSILERVPLSRAPRPSQELGGRSNDWIYSTMPERSLPCMPSNLHTVQTDSTKPRTDRSDAAGTARN